MDDTAKAAVVLNSLYRISTWSGRVFVLPRKCPEITDTAPNSPIARAVHKTTPYSKVHLIWGKVIRRKIVNAPAPIKAAASSSSFPWAFSTGNSSRNTNGNVTNIVARTTPGTANTILMSYWYKKSPIHPIFPNVRINTSPAITGEMENGISIRVARTCLPGK